MKTFYHLLGNNLIAGIINFTIWFAITFYTYLQTQSVFATGTIAGIYLVATAVTGIWFGSLVDHYRKKSVMIGSSVVSLIAYIASFIIYVTAGSDAFKDVANPLLWIFVLVLMVGVIAGNIRNIVIPVLVTMLIPEDRRDHANGLVGTAGGISFLITSVFSGLLVGYDGMFSVLALAILLTVVIIVHLLIIKVKEEKVVHLNQEHAKIDLRGTIKIILGIPGLMALILFATINNLLSGVFMSLMDAYGLNLVSVQAWGFLWGVLSTGFIIGGLLIAKFGLGKNPLKTLFIANIIIWSVASVFTLNSSIILLAVGMYAFILTMPFIEASEQTIFQKVVPQERQGRVFGFSQSVEQAASPLTAFLIGPLTQFIFIPYMTNGAGAQMIGSWFGTGPDRGIALVFTIAGILGLIVTILAFSSKYYKQLSTRYLKA